MRILIVGAGWLGQALAIKLQAQGHQLVVTKTTSEGVANLQALGLDARLLALPAAPEQTLVHPLAGESFDWVIGAFPPGLRKATDAGLDDYANRWQHLMDLTRELNIKRCMMISTTGVYPSVAQRMQEDDASFEKAKQSEQFSVKAKAILKAEDVAIRSETPSVILRCSGLIGPERHPKRFVQYMKTISTLAPANMVHQADVIAACEFMIEQDIQNQVLNLTSPKTVDKASFYQAALGDTPLTDYVELSQQADKYICADKILGLGFEFIYSDSLAAVKALNKTQVD
ncbi:MAG: NAD-dependent epimerase/dehydratase family protein [Vibrio sp.]